MARIGILGGTFDPIHNGHIECAVKIKQEFSLSKVLLLPAGNPPHKFASPVTPASLRLKMVEIAAKGIEGIEVCDIEVKRGGYTFTSDTLAELSAIYLGDDLFYVIGTDSAKGIGGWKNASALPSYCKFIIVNRAGSQDMLPGSITAMRSIDAGYLISTAKISCVSSSELRGIFECGELPPPGVISPDLADFIISNRVYEKGPANEERIIEDLSSVLTEKRFIHSLGVADEAVRLAEKFGADTGKARLAGLLHDCAKTASPDQLKWIGMTLADFSSSPADGFSARVLHGPLGAIVAKKRYGVDDPEILSAISRHTTGAGDMSLLDKIVFIADYTEKNRSGEFFDNVRRLADTEGLSAAIVYSCNETIKKILQRGEPIDINTIYTRNSLLAEIEKEKQS